MGIADFLVRIYKPDEKTNYSGGRFTNMLDQLRVYYLPTIRLKAYRLTKLWRFLDPKVVLYITEWAHSIFQLKKKN